MQSDIIENCPVEGRKLYAPTIQQLLRHLAESDSIFWCINPESAQFEERTVLHYAYTRQVGGRFTFSITISAPGGSVTMTITSQDYEAEVKASFRLAHKTGIAVPLYLRGKDGKQIKIAEFDSLGSGWVVMIDPEGEQMFGQCSGFCDTDAFVRWLDEFAPGGPTDLILSERL